MSLQNLAKKCFNKIWQLPTRQAILLMLAMYPAALINCCILLGGQLLIPDPEKLNILSGAAGILIYGSLIISILLNIKLIYSEKDFLRVFFVLFFIFQICLFRIWESMVVMVTLMIFWYFSGTTFY
jgi:hypothetical protein